MLLEAFRAKASTCLALLPLALALIACGKSTGEKEAEAKEAAHRERYAKAEALFRERCKTAGVVIKRTVKDVEAIELAKLRKEIPWGGNEYFDPMYAEAAMAGETRGDDYIKQFMMYEFQELHQPGVRGQLGPSTTERPGSRPATFKGYSFVEFVDSRSGTRYRCTPDWSRDHPNWVTGQHRCLTTETSGTQYALDYEDLGLR